MHFTKAEREALLAVADMAFAFIEGSEKRTRHARPLASAVVKLRHGQEAISVPSHFDLTAEDATALQAVSDAYVTDLKLANNEREGK